MLILGYFTSGAAIRAALLIDAEPQAPACLLISSQAGTAEIL
jgi:hypothetical protein